MTTSGAVLLRSGTAAPPVSSLGVDDKLWYVRSGVLYYRGQDGVEHNAVGVDPARVLTAGAGLAGGGDLSADRTFDVNVDNATIEINADTVRVKDSGITLAKQADMAQAQIRGRKLTAGTGPPQDMSPTEAKAVLAIVPADVTGFDTQVRTSRLDQMATPNVDVSWGSHKITSLLTPTGGNDAANKAYVDGVAAGLSIKPSVASANTSGNITLVGAQTIDGIAGAIGQRVLLTSQTSPIQNGLWLQQTAAWTRPTDFPTLGEASGAFVFVEGGTLNGASGWTVLGEPPVTIDTNNQTWTQFSGAGEIIDGAALLKTGNTLDVRVDGVGIEVNADLLRLKDAGVTLAKMANEAASSLLGNNTGSPATPLALTPAQVKTLLAIASGDVSGLGTAAVANVDNSTVEISGGNIREKDAGTTLAKLADLAQSRLIGRAAAAGTGVPQALTPAQIATVLGLAISPSRDYGATFDHRVVFDGACSTGANTKITSATAAFVAADNGKRIVLATAGASSAPYVGTITAIDSATQVTVSPAISTTASAKGLQVHTDDLAAWNNIVTDVNAFSRGGAHVLMDARVGTQRSGISGDINTFTKAITLEGFGSSYNHDVGDYSAVEGVCLAYAGATQSTNGTFGQVLTFAPTAGASNPAMGGPVLRNFWIDCRNGDQNPALGGINLQSCHGAVLDTVFVMDPGAYGLLTGVLTPGTSTSLGEDRGCDRNYWGNFRARCLENAFIGTAGALATLTPTTTSTAVTLTTSGQALTIAAANGIATGGGYVWIMTENGYPVLVNYTSLTGGNTLNGCTVSLADAQNTPKTLSGSNVVQAVPNNAIIACFDGDLTHNTNLSVGMMWQCSTGTNWGPAAIEFRNSDTVELVQVVINGGNATNDGAINRIRRPGVRFNGSDSNVGFPARNNVMRSGDPGAGGCSSMGLKGGGAKMAFPAGPNTWDRYQLGNAAPIPTEEAFSCLLWDGNGALPPGESGVVSVATQTIAAATLTLLNGSLIALPPQWCQAGTTLRWTIMGATTVGAAAAATFSIRLGANGTTADAIVFTPTLPVGAAGTIGFKLVLEMVVRVPGVPPTAVTTRCHALLHNGNTGAVTGIANLAQVQFTGAGTAFNAQTSGLLYAHVSYTGGAGVTVAFEQVECEVIKCANP